MLPRLFGRNRRSRPTDAAAAEALEVRVLLSADGLEHDHDGAEILELAPVAALDFAATSGAAGATAAAAAALAPLSSIPVLNSLPSAAATLYLDFDGHSQPNWGSYGNVSTPAFDQDGDTSTFSTGELATIRAIWEYVSEDYAPFQINVTTVEPPSFANGVALRVSIGGDGSWLGVRAGGVAYIDSFTNSIANTVFVFAKNLSNGNAKSVADASSHEAGHGFGLQHQSQYNGAGAKVQDYYSGPGDGRAPLMGLSYSATRSLWWYGTTTSSMTFQDDVAIIGRSANGFGFRTDDHGDSIGASTPLIVSGTQVSGSGIVSTLSDADYFSFTTDAGLVTLNVTVPNFGNLDTKLELRNVSGQVVASAAPSNGLGGTISGSLGAGTYYLVVTSNGRYGDLGQYSISGTIVQPAVANVEDVDLAGPWQFGGGLTAVRQSGDTLTFVNERGGTSAGIWLSDTQVMATGWGNLVGTIDATTADSGRITWSNGSVWLRIELGGQYAIGGNGLPSVIQTGSTLTFVNEAGGQSLGVLQSATQVVAIGWGNLVGTLTKNGTIQWHNGSVWRKLDLSPDYTNNANGLATHVRQDGTSLTFVDESGTESAGKWISTTQVQLVDSGRVGTVANGQIVWSNGTIWNKDLTIFGTITVGNALRTVTIRATNQGVTFINENGAGTTVSITGLDKLFASMWQLGATRQNGQIQFGNNTVWSNFDFNALNAIFSDLTSFPF